MTQLTEADYDIDIETLMASMGIEPGTVVADTAKLQFLSGKAVLTYTVMRAIPPRVLGVAILRSAAQPDHATEDAISNGNAIEAEMEPTPIKKAAAKRTAKKTTGKRPGK